MVIMAMPINTDSQYDKGYHLGLQKMGVQQEHCQDEN